MDNKHFTTVMTLLSLSYPGFTYDPTKGVDIDTQCALKSFPPDITKFPDTYIHSKSFEGFDMDSAEFYRLYILESKRLILPSKLLSCSTHVDFDMISNMINIPETISSNGINFTFIKNLKVIKFIHEIPITGSTSLVSLDINHCEKLVEIDVDMDYYKKLSPHFSHGVIIDRIKPDIDIINCDKLKLIKTDIIRAASVNISHCKTIKTLPPITGENIFIQSLDSISKLENIEASYLIRIRDCKNLKSLENIKCKYLDITNCPNLTSIPRKVYKDIKTITVTRNIKTTELKGDYCNL